MHWDFRKVISRINRVILPLLADQTSSENRWADDCQNIRGLAHDHRHLVVLCYELRSNNVTLVFVNHRFDSWRRRTASCLTSWRSWRPSGAKRRRRSRRCTRRSWMRRGSCLMKPWKKDRVWRCESRRLKNSWKRALKGNRTVIVKIHECDRGKKTERLTRIADRVLVLASIMYYNCDNCVYLFLDAAFQRSLKRYSRNFSTR